MVTPGPEDTGEMERQRSASRSGEEHLPTPDEDAFEDRPITQQECEALLDWAHDVTSRLRDTSAIVANLADKTQH